MTAGAREGQGRNRTPSALRALPEDPREGWGAPHWDEPGGAVEVEAEGGTPPWRVRTRDGAPPRSRTAHANATRPHLNPPGGQQEIVEQPSTAHALFALAPDMSADDRLALDALMRTWPASSRRALACDLRGWSRWCTRNRVRVDLATGPDLARFIRDLAGTGPETAGGGEAEGQGGWRPPPRAPASIARLVSSLSRACRLMNRPDLTRHPTVREALHAARLTARQAARGQRALTLRPPVGLRLKGDVVAPDDPPEGICLLNLLRACGRDWLGLRDAALLRVAYDTACRRAELVGMRVEHVSHLPDGSGRIALPPVGPDRGGQGRAGTLSPETMVALDAWIRAARPGGQGPLFRRVRTDFEGTPIEIASTPLHPDSIGAILARAVWRAQGRGVLGLTDAEVRAWLSRAGSRSLRIGRLQDHIAAGDTGPEIASIHGPRAVRTLLR